MPEINSEQIEPCKFRINYTSDVETVQEKRQEALKQLRKASAKVKGFRNSKKAPDSVLNQQYKTHVEQWVRQEMLTNAYDDVIFETKLKPIGRPEVISVNLQNNKFTCEMVFMSKPEFELVQPIKNVEVPKPHQEISAADLTQKMIQELREKQGSSTPFEETDQVALNDTLTMDIQTNDEIKEGELYVVGSNLLAIEFDNNILGMLAGETREFTIEEKNYKVTVHMGMKKIPAALDDELAVKVGLKTYDELVRAVEGMAISRVKQLQDQKVSEQIVRRLVDSHNIELPEWLISIELQEIIKRKKTDMNVITEEEQSKLNKQAVDSIKFALILDSIRESEPEAELTESEAIGLLRQELSRRGVQEVDQTLQSFQNDGRLIGMIASAKNSYALQWIVDNAKLVE